MKGLLRNNYYESLGGVKLLLALGLAGGIGLLASGSTTILQLIVLLLPMALALNGAGSIRKNDSAGWSRYEMILPIRRKKVMKSRYFAFLLWILLGLLFAAVITAVASGIHGGGRFFDRGWKDFWSLFSMGLGLSMAAGAYFHMTITMLGSDRSEIIMLLSVAASFGTVIFFIWVVNLLFFEMMPYYLQLVIFCGACMFLYLVSYVLSLIIYDKKEL